MSDPADRSTALPGQAEAGPLWIAALAVAIAIVWPNASESVGDIAVGDVSMFQRLLVVQLGAAAALLGFHRRLGPALFDGGAVCLPAWAHVAGVPAALGMLACVWLAWALYRARSTRQLLLIAALSAATQILGSAGWIFHYFEQPLLPSLVAATLSILLWSPACLLATRLCQRSLLWLPIAAACWPATEWVRGVALSPPLPGLFLAHAAADSGWVPLLSGFGELGISFGVSAFAFAAATLLERAPRRGIVLIVATLAIGGFAPLTGERAEEGSELRVCAVEDPHRIDRHQAAFGGGGATAIKALFRRAVENFACDVTILPEYSLELRAEELVSAEIGAARAAGPVLLGGAYASVRDDTGRPQHVRNVVCQMHENGSSFLCSDPLDKLVFAPFGEAALFYDSPWLAALGRWLTRQATGDTFEGLATLRGQGSVRAGQHRFGAAICWEILVPGIFQRRGIARGDVSLLVVPSDLDGFGGSRQGIEQFRRASRIHALRLHTPLVFASTHGAFLLSSRGEAIEPAHREAFFVVWDVPNSR